MANLLLNSIAWYDLPLANLSVSELGVELVVTPWIESVDAYARYALRIREAESLELDVTGELSSRDFRDLEVSKFEYTIDSAGRISGTIGILPGGAGYWGISFANAMWSFEAA